MTPDTNQFLNDCCTALLEVKGEFHMGYYFKHVEGGRWPSFHSNVHQEPACGTPACVLGHYAYWKMGGVSVGASDFANYIHLGALEGRGLTEGQREELFHGDDGCGGAKTAQEAIAYIEDFILRNGGIVHRRTEPGVTKLVASLITEEPVLETA
jgi:hypothetical protein